MILPEALAGDFLHFCQRNPKPCPLLAVSKPGEPLLPTLGDDVDIRSDVPRYRVWRRGELEVQNFYGLKARQCDCNSAVKAHFDEVLAGTYPV